MALFFYFFSFLTIIFTVFSIMQSNAVYALFYFALSILTTSTIFFECGSYFIGSLQVIIYAGAIIVLFIFVIMMLNTTKIIEDKKIYQICGYYWMYPMILLFLFILFMINVLFCLKNKYIYHSVINLKILGINLFGSYLLLIEFISMLLFSALLVVFLISGNKKKDI